MNQFFPAAPHFSDRIRSRPSEKILIVLHQETSSPGRIGRLLRNRGMELDIRQPRYGDPLPADLSDHAGAIIFGGPMSANDEEDYIKREIDWIGVPLSENKPFMGICLGAQMLARHLGHRVYRHPRGKVEIGYHPIRPTAAGQSCCDTSFPEQVYQWHCEGFDLPCGAALLAEGCEFEAQAFRYGAAYGLQFHPEVTYAMICGWTVRGEHRLSEDGAHPQHLHRQGWYLHDAAVALWLAAFLRTWLGTPLVKTETCSSPRRAAELEESHPL
jgi:GMP synthase (glutamine-hydrolysing)